MPTPVQSAMQNPMPTPMQNPMQSTVRERQCYTKDCDVQAEFACMRCGKPLCAEHAHLVRLERRVDAREHPHDLPALARLPSQIKTYAFCLRCG